MQRRHPIHFSYRTSAETSSNTNLLRIYSFVGKKIYRNSIFSADMSAAMIVRKTNVSSTGLTAARMSVRQFSSKELTKEELEEKADLQKIETFRKYKQKSFLPTSMTDVMGLPEVAGLPKNLSELSVFNGMPTEHARRTVSIAPKPLKSLQSGDAGMHLWEITWETKENWSNPLMGWTSSADPLSNLVLTFNSSESAVNFAEKNGWKYIVANPTSKYVVKQGTFNYMSNFLPKKTMLAVNEQGIRKNVVFKNSAYGASHWFPPITYDGTDLVEQHGPAKE